MKIVIISDIHGNNDALLHLPECDWDELWVLGDLVSYGPESAEVVEAVRHSASIIVQGNHDFAVAWAEDSHWGAPSAALSSAARQVAAEHLSDEQRQFLGALPRSVRTCRKGHSFYLVHATPSDPLYTVLHHDSPVWGSEVEKAGADILLTGHTHIPFIRQFGNKTLVNPGSIGQPRDGSNRASYAIWQDGQFSLRRYTWPVKETIRKTHALAIGSGYRDKLITILKKR